MSRYINPVPFIQDNDGVPIVGAKLFFFEPGTTTLKTIYSDPVLTNPTTNPQLSDDGGRYTNDIYLDGSYDVTQQDNSGTPTGFDGITLWGPKRWSQSTEGQLQLWDSTITYETGDIVLGSDGNYYRSLQTPNQGNDPTTSSTFWELLRFGRVWNASITYDIGDSVYGNDGFLYLSRVASNLNNDPTLAGNNDKWRPGANVRYVKGADVASAATLPIGKDGNHFDVTGTTTITALENVGVGTIVKLRFTGILILTHNATTLDLPGEANITTQVGDESEFYQYAAGNWRCLNYTRNDGTPLYLSADSVGDAELKTAVGTTGTQTLGIATTWTPAAGYYNIVQTGGAGLATLDIFVSGVWRSAQGAGFGAINGMIWADGSNMRILANGNAVTFYWQKLG